MAIELHPECRSRLIELLANALPKIQIMHGKFVKRSSEALLGLIVANQALPQKGAIHEMLLAYIDEHPILDFVHDTLTDELRDAQYLETETQSLTTIEGYESAADVATRLVDQLMALPNEYKLSFRLPRTLWPMLTISRLSAELNPRIRIVRGDASLNETLPLTSDNKELEG